jgi:hypothetical protein
LENFDDTPWDKMGEASPCSFNNNTVLQSSGAMKLVNSDGIPNQGYDRWQPKVFVTTHVGQPG